MPRAQPKPRGKLASWKSFGGGVSLYIFPTHFETEHAYLTEACPASCLASCLATFQNNNTWKSFLRQRARLFKKCHAHCEALKSASSDTERFCDHNEVRGRVLRRLVRVHN